MGKPHSQINPDPTSCYVDRSELRDIVALNGHDSPALFFLGH